MEYNNLVVVAASSRQELGTQRCFMDPRAMDKLGAKLGQPVEVSMKNRKYLCSLWPREDKADRYITVDTTVKQLSNSRQPTHKVSGSCVEDIRLLQAKSSEKICVTVVLKNYKSVSKHSKSYLELVEVVYDALYGSVIASQYRYSCRHNLIGDLYEISDIIINSTVPECQACTVNRNTAIIIEKVISKERLDSTLQHKPVVLGGLEQQTIRLKDLIETPCKQRDRLSKLGLTYPKSILVHGPIGCGKTSLVKFVTQDCDAHLISVTGAEVIGSLPGESEENLRRLFEKAVVFSEECLCVLFLDELDALCPARKKGSGSLEGRVISQLVALLDELNSTQQLTVIGATNRPGSVDAGIRRRFDQEIIIGIPTLEQRHSILLAITEGLMLVKACDLHELAEATPGYVGADLASLVQQAAYMALVEQEYLGQPEITVNHFQQVLHSLIPTTQRGSDIRVDFKPVLWDQIGGLEEVKTQLKQAIEWPLKHPNSFRRLGLKPPSGLLLYGPPGCAKTKLVQAVATNCHVTFLAVSGAQLFSPYVGDSERKITEVFQQARAGAPSILFIDEIDSVVGSRSKGHKSGGVHDRVLSTLLNEMDGIGVRLDYSQRNTSQRVAEGDNKGLPTRTVEEEAVDNSRVIVVAATNRPDMLDDALIRPGRIDRILYVPPPDLQARQKILEIHTRHIPLEDVDLGDIADKCDRFTGADLENLCRETALHALSVDGLEVKHVTKQHFQETLKCVSPSLSLEKLTEYCKIKHVQR